LQEELRMNRSTLLAFCLAGAIAPAVGADAGFRLEKQFELDPGASFSLRSDVGGVEVRGVEGDQATIVVTSSRDDFADKFDIRFEPSGRGRLDVTIERKGGQFHWFSWNGGAHVAVDLPKKAMADLHSSGGGIEVTDLGAKLVAKSSGGGVHVYRIDGDVVVSSSGGSVEIEDVAGGARLDSSGGSVRARNVGGDIEASSSGGGVKIEEAGGEVVADSSGGPVRVGFAAGNSKGGDLSSSGGGVHVQLDPKAALHVDAHSSGGGVTCELPVTVHGKIGHDSLNGELNGGGSATLKLRSSGGGITIEER
jgi:hypothetical protein